MYKTASSTVARYSMLVPGDIIIVGVSGGADSMALLDYLYKYSNVIDLKIKVVHVNHHIRAEDADADAAFVEQYCKQSGIDYVVYDYNIPDDARHAHISEEEAGRLRRYESFSTEAMLIGANKIAVAHNKDDNVETILINILRGTGTSGVLGIPRLRDMIVRPLIECSRMQIEVYCTENNVPFITDKTNNEPIYTRNKLRNVILPYIKREINPSVDRAVLQLSNILENENNYMEYETKRLYDECLVSATADSVTLCSSRLKGIHTAIAYRIIRKAIEYVSGTLKNVAHVNIRDIYSLSTKQTGKSVILTSGCTATRCYNSIVFANTNAQNIAEKQNGYCYRLKLGDFIFVPELMMYVSVNSEKQKNNYHNVYTKAFNYDKMGEYIWLRTRLPGDKIFLKNVGSKKLKDFFIDKKVPSEERGAIPLIANSEEVIWIVNMRASDKFAVIGSSKTIFVEFWEDIKNECDNH